MKFIVCPLVLMMAQVSIAAPVPRAPSTPDPLGKTIIGIHSSNKAKVNSLYPVSPFKNAGGKVGDVITKIGYEDVDDLDSLVGALKSYRPGATINVVIMRGKEEMILKVTLGEDKSKIIAKNDDDDDEQVIPPRRPPVQPPRVGLPVAPRPVPLPVPPAPKKK